MEQQLPNIKPWLNVHFGILGAPLFPSSDVYMLNNACDKNGFRFTNQKG